MRIVIFFLLVNCIALQVSAQPENVRVLMRTAEKKLQEKDYSGALEYNNAALALCATCYQLENQKGRILAESGDLPNAMQSFKKAAKLCNQCGIPYLSMGFYQAQQKKYDEAKNYLQHVIDKDTSTSNLAFAYRLLGAMYGDEKNYAKAYEVFTKSYALKKDLFVLYRMILNEIHTNQPDKVNQHLANFIFSDSSVFAYAYYSYKGSLYSHMRKYDSAFINYSKSIQLNGNYAYSLMGQATAASVLGKKELAIASIEKAQLLKPNDKDVTNSAGFVKIHLKQYTEAIKDFEKAIAIDNTISEPYNNIGYVYYLLGGADNFKKALYYYDKAIEVGSDGYNPYWKYRDLVLPK